MFQLTRFKPVLPNKKRSHLRLTNGNYLVSIQLFQTFWSLALAGHVVLTFQLITTLRVLQHALGNIWFPCRGMQNRNMLSHKISHQTVKMLQGAENHLRQHHKSFINFTAYESRATSDSFKYIFHHEFERKTTMCVYNYECSKCEYQKIGIKQ